MKYYLIITITVLFAHRLCAQTISSEIADTVYQAQEIIVTANRIKRSIEDIPASVSVIGRDKIQQGQKGIGLDEALSILPGVIAQNRHNFSLDTRLSIRGFGSRSSFGVRGVTILVDGIPETLPDGQTSLDNIDLSSTGRIEVLRGPGSALYGNAAGGVIHLFTEVAHGKPYIQVTPLTVGEDGLRLSNIKSAGQVGRVNYTISASQFELDGYREYSRAKQKNITGRIHVPAGTNTGLLIVANFADSPLAQSAGALTEEQIKINPRQAAARNVQTKTGEAVRQGRLGISLKGHYGAHSLTNTAYGVMRTLDNNLPFAVIDLNRKMGGYRFLYSYQSFSGKFFNRFSIGSDLQYQKDDRMNHNNVNGIKGDETLLDQIETVSSVGVFLQDELQVNSYTEIIGALRYDRIKFSAEDRLTSDGDDSGNRVLMAFSPQIGVTVKPFPGKTSSLFANVSTSFETPTTTELVNRPDGGGGFNPDLGPQRAISYELGLKAAFAKHAKFLCSAYTMSVSDELISFRVPNSPERDFYRNIGRSAHRGIELELSLDLPSGFSGYSSYTFTDVSFIDFNTENDVYDGNRLPGIPRRQGALQISYSRPAGPFAAVTVRHTGDYYTDDANTVTNKSYTLAGIRCGYNRYIGHYRFSPFIGINNVFNKNYVESVVVNAFGGRYFEPAPDRDIYGGVRLAYQF